MAFTSKGYSGPILPADWSLLVPGMASTYNVEGDGLATTSTGVLQTTTTAGVAAGYGITDTEANPTILTYSANTAGVAGSIRYDMVVLRRTWGSSLSALVVITGSTSQITAIGMRTTGRNVVDDQPIALVPIINGASNPGTPIDLRLWTANGGSTAESVLVLQYLTAAGGSVQIGADLWQRVRVAGIATWVPNVRPQQGWEKFIVASPEVKHVAGVALTGWISIIGPPRAHAIRVSVSGHGGFAGSATSVGVVVQRNSPVGVLDQDPSTTDCLASKWVSITNSALLSGLPANTVTQLRCAADGSEAYHRGSWSWDVI